ncbi:MAG: hypothetical protein KCHDKBKB_00129 [Elusimicrobia bacterium]|nr:hypothetical protein [Elusimicrobiota bacterium]
MLYSANKHGFRLKGFIRCGVCNGAIVGFVQPKKGKEYRYYRCIGKVNGIPTPCPIKCIGADKIEEFVIEKLASLGSDRTLLEKVVQKVEKKSKSQIRPLSQERRNIEERIKSTNREIQNLLNLVKAGGKSQQAVEEIKRLENSKREMEAKAIEIDARIAQRKRAVYDVDAIRGALHRFARFIYRIPMQLQIYALGILIKRVTITRNTIEVELNEVAIETLQKCFVRKANPEWLFKYFSNKMALPESLNQSTVSTNHGAYRLV